MIHKSGRGALDELAVDLLGHLSAPKHVVPDFADVTAKPD